MRYESIIHRFVPFLIILACMLFTQDILILQSVHAAEKYERKSISFLNDILLTPSAAQIPKDKASELMREIRKEMEMPRLDYNDVPKSLQTEFWEESREHFSQTMQSLSSIKTSMDQTDRSLDDAQRNIARLDNLIFNAISGGRDASKYRDEKRGYEKQERELSERRASLLVQRHQEEEVLFGQAAELLTKVIAPTLLEVLSDSDLQRLRAQRLVNPEEWKKFIVEKARELPITSEDLEKVMDSAYLYMIVLTDYGRVLIIDQETGGKTVTYRLSGGIIWFKFVVPEDLAGEPRMQILKTIKVDASVSGNPDVTIPFTNIDGDTYTFGRVVKKLASDLKMETLKIDDFALKTGVVEVSGSKVSFPLGKQEGIFIDQKFSVYEKQKRGDQITEKKRGFFYVDKIGDDVSDRDRLSYGKMVIHGAEPGMQMREFPTIGVDLSIRFRTGRVKIGRGNVSAAGYSLNVKNEVNTSVYALNAAVQYDIGRNLQIPQSFVTIGGDMGSLIPIDDITIGVQEPDMPLYFDVYAGFLKKWYIRRAALCFEPSIQFQFLSIGFTDASGNTTSFDTSTLSFSPKVGVEFAVQEDVNIGLTLSSEIPIQATDEWSGSLSSSGGPKDNLFEGTAVGPKVTYPKVSFGVYVSYCLPKLWW